MTALMPPRVALTPPPVLPALVHVAHRGDRYIIHAVPRHGTVPMTTAAIRHAEPTWCDQCWPERRCVICGTPSGERGECTSCTADALIFEKRRDAVDGWDAA